MSDFVQEPAPVRGKARIDVLDILRGIAILGILYMNIPIMGANVALVMEDPRRIGWSAADQATWAVIDIFWEGTQRGLLEFLFGAGVLILSAKAMRPDGPVSVADLHYRRNLWLIVFGIVDIFIIGWVGDILLIYGLAALFIFPFRTLPAKALIPLGLLFATASAIGLDGRGAMAYLERTELMQTAELAAARSEAGETLSESETQQLETWRSKVRRLDLAQPFAEEMQKVADADDAARSGSPLELLTTYAYFWYQFLWLSNEVFLSVLEAICAMFLGMALWKLGIIQGERPLRFYALTALAAYALGGGLRAWGVVEALAFTPGPKTIWIFGEFARLAVTLGHVALVNLVLKTAGGRAVLAPFKAAGRTAFSLYILTSVLAIWVIFAPWGLGLWGRFSWAELALAATIINIGLLILANLWVGRFAAGPLEWTWRSLAYWQRQPFRLEGRQPPLAAEPGVELYPPQPR